MWGGSSVTGLKVDICMRWCLRVEVGEIQLYSLLAGCSCANFSVQLPGKLNELDQNGDLALDLALSRRLESIASTLVSHKADVDMVDKNGWSLLHKGIQRGRRKHSFCFSLGAVLLIQVTFEDALTPFHKLPKASWVCTRRPHDGTFVLRGSEERPKHSCLTPRRGGLLSGSPGPLRKARKTVLSKEAPFTCEQLEWVFAHSDVSLSPGIVLGRLYLHL